MGTPRGNLDVDARVAFTEEDDCGDRATARTHECSGRADHRQIQVTRQISEGLREPRGLDQTGGVAAFGVKDVMKPAVRRTQINRDFANAPARRDDAAQERNRIPGMRIASGAKVGNALTGCGPPVRVATWVVQRGWSW